MAAPRKPATLRRKPATRSRTAALRQLEADFQSSVFDLGERFHRVRMIHIPKVQIRPGRWITPYQGRGKGLTDLILIGPGGLAWRELKLDGEDPKPHQVEMMDDLRAAGEDVAVWQPADLRSLRISAELARLNRPRPDAHASAGPCLGVLAATLRTIATAEAGIPAAVLRALAGEVLACQLPNHTTKEVTRP